MQHLDHTDREREYGAGGEREGREKEEGTKVWLSKLRIHLTSKDAAQPPQFRM